MNVKPSFVPLFKGKSYFSWHGVSAVLLRLLYFFDLHPGKDFAVSPAVLTVKFQPSYRAVFPLSTEGIPCFCKQERHCSHLSPCGGWVLPTTFFKAAIC